jgi:hypothetical protein
LNPFARVLICIEFFVFEIIVIWRCPGHEVTSSLRDPIVHKYDPYVYWLVKGWSRRDQRSAHKFFKT